MKYKKLKTYLFSQCQHKRPKIIWRKSIARWNVKKRSRNRTKKRENKNTCVDSTVYILVQLSYLSGSGCECVCVCAKPIWKQLFQNILKGFTKMKSNKSIKFDDRFNAPVWICGAWCRRVLYCGFPLYYAREISVFFVIWISVRGRAVFDWSRQPIVLLCTSSEHTHTYHRCRNGIVLYIRLQESNSLFF